MDILNSIIGTLITIGAVGSVFLTLAKINENYNPLMWFKKEFNKIKEEISTLNQKQETGFTEIKADIKEIREEQKNHKLDILALKFCSPQIPINERLKAGQCYVECGGNGDIKAKYEAYEKKYVERMSEKYGEEELDTI